MDKMIFGAALLILGLVLWPGFVLYTVCVGSRGITKKKNNKNNINKNILETLVFSTAFGLSFLAVICPVLDIVWEISIISIGMCVLFLSGLLLVTPITIPTTFEKWELLILGAVLGLAFVLRSSSLCDIIPEGQDAWVHLSFMHHIHSTHHIPHIIPWLAEETPLTLKLYPPGSHCLGALLSFPFQNLPLYLIKVVFIVIGTGSCLSLYVVVKQVSEKKVAILSTLVAAVFVPHMVNTTEITAQALGVFLFPVAYYFFYKRKIAAACILLGGIILVHHITAIIAVLCMFTLTLGLFVREKKWKYLYPFFVVVAIGVILSSTWWGQLSFQTGMMGFASNVSSESFLENVELLSPLFVIFSMVGFFVLLKEKKEYSLFLLCWAIPLFLGSQFSVPLGFRSQRFIQFFVFPGSFLAALGLLKVKSVIPGKWFIILILLTFSLGYPPRFWPPTGEENVYATEWIKDSSLDSVAYVYGRFYIFVYVLADTPLYEISDYDNPFGYDKKTTYFYDDGEWLPHDIEEFGQFDQVYSCSQVIISRIEHSE
ncbi:MAG: hypothetical protein PVF58_16220 [Candidatus Methanofastidiosia archaeon]